MIDVPAKEYVPVKKCISISFNKFWRKQEDAAKAYHEDQNARVMETWAMVSHITSITNKWVQRAAQGTAVAAQMQKVLINIQIGQMAASAAMLSIQSAFAFGAGDIGRGIFLATLAADMTLEINFLITQRTAAEQAKAQSEQQAAAVKSWRESYN